MLDKIISFSLKNKYLILLLSVLLVILGIRTSGRMNLDVFPDFTSPTVVVMTDAPGMAPEEVEQLVTFPIETAVNGASNVRRVRSVSAQGFSFVNVDFDWGTDIYKARQIVSEKLITVSAEMPLGVSQPVLAPQSSVMGEIFYIGMQADSTSLMDLRTIAEWNVKPTILATNGVSQVTIMGGDFKQYQILMNPHKMRLFDVSLQELLSAVDGISQNSSGSVIRQYGNEYTVRGIGRTANLDELAGTFVKLKNDKPIRIGDVADVVIGSAVKMGQSSQNGEPAIIISVSKQPNVNTLKLTENIEHNIRELQKTLPPDIKVDTEIFRSADFIQTSVNNVANALLEGAFFVVIILFLFLGSFRTTIISLLAIPLSLLGTVLVLDALGLDINTMSLGGMAIAIGSLVDDAIIDVENVYKRLRQNRLKPIEEQKSYFTVVLEASIEIRASILNATLIIIAAFIPLFFLSGMEGKMLQPLGISFIVSLSMSLILAMTLTPLLAKILLGNEKYLAKNEKEKWLVRKLIHFYEKSLTWLLNHQKTVVYSTLAVVVIAVLLMFRMGRSFLPEFNEGSLTVNIAVEPGVSLDDSDNIGSFVEGELLQIPEITSTARRTGRGELDEHSQTVNSAEIEVAFDLDKRSRNEFLADVRNTLANIPTIAASVGQPLSHRIDHMLSGTNASIAIKIFGDDLVRLFNMGNLIKNAIEDIDGLVDLNIEQQVEVPQIQIRAKRDLLAYYGISMDDFHTFINVALGEEKRADIYEGQNRFDLIVKLNSQYNSGIEDLKSVLVDAKEGAKVPLGHIADVVSASGPSSISRENVQRKIVVSANVADRDMRTVVEEIQEKVNAQIDFPEGYRIEYGGQFESEAKASRTLLLTFIISIVVIFFLLYYEFKDFTLSGLILLNLPLALIGGVFSIAIGSNVMSIPSIIGFITLFGIATRNGILLVSNYQRLQNKGVPLFETIIQGSSDRLNAILMTALTAALALVPLVVKGDMPGNEIQSPMAQVILGGLLTSTLLNIYIVPMVYNILCKKGFLKH